MRVSVTDRCNFRCQYCMPAEGLPWLNRDALLSYEEIERLVRLLSAMGVHDVRLTGGEPLVRKELWRLVEKLSAIEDVHDLSLTTNGYLLERQVADLVRAGLRRVNVSLDALAPDRFFQLTRRDSLHAGARRASRPPRRTRSCARSRSTSSRCATSPRPRSSASPSSRAREPYVIRFIEFMPLDADRTWSRDRVLPNEEVRAMIDAVYPLEPVGRERHGTSRRWRFADGKGEIGFISPVTEPFCGDCNRIRLTAEGELRTCLFSMTETDLREPLRAGATDAELEAIIRDAVWRKELKHHVNDAGFVQPERTMSPHRRMNTIDQALARDPRRDRAAGLRAGAAGRRRGAGGRRGRRRGRRPAAVRPLGDGRLRRPLRRHGARRRAAARGRRGRRRGRHRRAGAGHRRGISTGAAVPPGADAILQSELAEVADGHVTPERAIEPGTHVRVPRRGRARRRRARPRRRAADGPAAVRAGLRRASARSPCTAARGCTCSSPARSCSRSARRPSRAASTSPTG